MRNLAASRVSFISSCQLELSVRAAVVTTVVLCVNFGLLAVSVFALNSELGMLTAGIILIALTIDLFLLPPLLLLLDQAVGKPPKPAPLAPA